MPKIKNILIFTGIAAAFALIYIFFIRPSSSQEALVSSPNVSLPDINSVSLNTGAMDKNSLVTKDFLILLLNVKNIKLDDSIFSDLAFNSLRDSSITLVQDSVEGRPNPFAQFGNDSLPVASTPPVAPATPAAPQNNNAKPTP